ncbi:MAG: ATP-binding cassette domain-containing protein [Myxococcales bacterium FL481]|nr:MAG: ATP-binding cassette domain-containing protein [Myxococcales bacterium FL481]
MNPPPASTRSRGIGYSVRSTTCARSSVRRCCWRPTPTSRPRGCAPEPSSFGTAGWSSRPWLGKTVVKSMTRSQSTAPGDLASPLLTVESLGVHARRTTRPLIHNVSFTVAAGEVVAVVGPSGAGKSTLARALVGLGGPRPGDAGPVLSGSLRWRGQAIAWGDRLGWRGLRRRISVCWQVSDRVFDPCTAVGDSVRLAGRLAGVSPTDLQQRIERWGSRLGLAGSVWSRRPTALSGGELQRVGLVRALSRGPELLIADEMTDAVDEDSRTRVLDAIARARDDGVAVILITHELAALRRLAQRLVVLDGGALVESGPAARLIAAPQHPTTRAWMAAARASPQPTPDDRSPDSRQAPRLVETPTNPTDPSGDLPG